VNRGSKIWCHKGKNWQKVRYEHRIAADQLLALLTQLNVLQALEWDLTHLSLMDSDVQGLLQGLEQSD